MAHLYSSFANRGVMKPLKFTAAESDTSSKVIISPEAGYLITQSLTRITRPDLPNSSSSSLRVPKVAWKTGTSYGRKDAWSIGYNTQYTIGVWAGNANNEGAADISGAEIATPILFDLFNTIDYNSPNQWYSLPKNLTYRFVCPITGKPSSDKCEQSLVDWYIPGVSQSQKCNHLVEVSVSADESISYCTSCRPSIGFKKKDYTDYPADLLAWMQRSGIQYDRIPPHNPYCTRVFKDSPPRIVSPLAQKEYILEASDPPQIRLSAETTADVNLLYWYVNDRFVGTSERGKDLFVSIDPGVVKISCTDDRGRNSDIQISVQHF
jgi:penicillin-binding protein 1C